MGYELRRWLADHLPADMGPMERLLLLELADRAHDDTRLAYGEELIPTVLRRTGLSDARQIAKTLARIAQKYGHDFRVPATNRDGTPKTDKLGRVVYAHKGHQTTYEIPRRLSWATPVRMPARAPIVVDDPPKDAHADHNGCPPEPQRMPTEVSKDAHRGTPTTQLPLTHPSPTSEEIYIPQPVAEKVGREGPAEEQRRSDALDILMGMDFARGVKRYETGAMMQRLADKLAQGWTVKQLSEAIDTGWNGALDRVAVTNSRIDALPDQPPRPRPGTPIPPPVAPPDYGHAAAPESVSRYADSARAAMRGARRP